jgi:Uma2 family endonuclease
MMVYVPEAKLSTYADASVVCGPLETVSVKRDGKSLGEGVTNPVVIIEVLSDSTERYDREEKFSYYRRLPSLMEYVLVSQTAQLVEVYRRPTDSTSRWPCEIARQDDEVTIHGRILRVSEVYGSSVS